VLTQVIRVENKVVASTSIDRYMCYRLSRTLIAKPSTAYQTIFKSLTLPSSHSTNCVSKINVRTALFLMLWRLTR
jgi:hypothetical protein